MNARITLCHSTNLNHLIHSDDGNLRNSHNNKVAIVAIAMIGLPLTPLVENVLLSEFDIDKGSSLSFQHPPLNHDPSMLAEWMLPEGVHLRQEDCTYFILNRPSLAPQTPAANQSPRFFKSLPPVPPERVLDPSVDYSFVSAAVLSDASITAFALIKRNDEFNFAFLPRSQSTVSLASPFLSIMDPIDASHRLQWSIANTVCEYYDEFTVAFWLLDPQLVIRFASVDDRVFFMRLVHRNASVKASSSKTVLNSVDTRLSEALCSHQDPLFVVNVVKVRHIAGVRRGARVKALAVTSKHPWVHVFKPLLDLALEMYFESPSDQTLVNVFQSLNALDTRHIPVLAHTEKKVLRTIIRNAHHHYNPPNLVSRPLKYSDDLDAKLDILHFPYDIEVPLEFCNVSIPLVLPLALYPAEFGDVSFVSFFNMISTAQVVGPLPQTRWKNDVPFTWHPHIDNGPSTHPVLLVLYSILTEKRLLFLGHGKPSKTVANCVLTCAAISSLGYMKDQVVSRCFPYMSLASLDVLLGQHGFIAGVTNPVFESQQGWWDVLYNMENNRITVSPKLIAQINESEVSVSAPPSVKLVDGVGSGGTMCSYDAMFIDHLTLGLKRNINEFHLRNVVYRYMEKFMFDSAYDSGNLPSQWRNHKEGWLKSTSYKSFKKAQSRLTDRTMFPKTNIKGMLDQLQALYQHSTHGTLVSCEALSQIVFTLDYVVQAADDDQIVDILALFTWSDGSAFPISPALFHERPAIRLSAARIIQRLFLQKLGMQYLNPFIKFALMRLLQSRSPDDPMSPSKTPDDVSSLMDSDAESLALYISASPGDTEGAIIMEKIFHDDDSIDSDEDEDEYVPTIVESQ